MSTEQAQDARKVLTRLLTFVNRFVYGQQRAVERILIGLLTEEHVLLEGNPGLAKTLLVRTFAKAMNVKYGRVQFTVDLLPSDILGSEILDRATSQLVLNEGPVFTNLLLADEINRATPKVQSALLEVMQERQVTIGNTSRPLKFPFLVVATQNPIELAGTYELPEAQLDRFLLVHRLEYPGPMTEATIVKESTTAIERSLFDRLEAAASVLDLADLECLRIAANHVVLDEGAVNWCVGLVQSTRKHPDLALGGSPRASIGLAKAARALAFLRESDRVRLIDVVDVAEDVLAHRIRPHHRAVAQGRNRQVILTEILNTYVGSN